MQKGSPASSYFHLVARPGRTLQLALIVANPAPYACSVTLEGAHGKTARNSGDTYPVAPPGHRCVRSGCWLSGLPRSVRVPARSRVIAPFAVRVPTGTPSGQYLAGVLARPTESGPAPTAPHGQGRVGVSIVAHVGIGVAIRVPGPLRPRLSIPSVTLDTAGGVPTLNIVERNTGNTWEHPRGGAQIQIGTEHRTYGTRSSTILPGDSATLTLPISDIRHGDRATEVVLWYAHHTRKAVWRGVLSFPSPPKAGGAVVGNRVVITSSRIPVWLIVLASALGGLLLVCASSLLILLRRRRRDAGESTTEL